MTEIKRFADLQALGAALKQQAKARQEEEERARRRAAKARQDSDLFRLAVGDVTPLPPQNRHVPQLPRPLPIARQLLADEQNALMESLSDEFDVESLLDTDQALSYARSGIGQDVVRKLRKGHWVIQDQLDLHGMRRDAAREALAHFLHRARRQGLRCVRVIHGKGLGSVNKEPVLKNMVHRWLVQKQEVLAFCVARAADGGNGALVVLLKGGAAP